MTNKEKAKLIRLTINHWDKMIKFVGTLSPDKEVDSDFLRKSIKEDWSGEFCELCKTYHSLCFSYIHTEYCPLNIYQKRSCRYNTPWRKVNLSETWSEWLKNAVVMIQTLKNLKKEVEKGNL